MAPLFDMFAQAQNGQAIELMAKQFGLAQEQMTKATAALLPAFSTGFKRNTANPYDFGALLTALSTGNYVKYFEDMRQAFTPEGVAAGNDILGQLFGSKEMSRAIAAQAAQITGIGQEVYKQMLPVMASTLMGGLFKETTSQVNEALTNNPMMTLMRQWMEATGLARKPEPQPNPFDNPFTQAMQGFFGVGKTQEKPKTPDFFADNPFFKAYQDMLRGSSAAAEKPPQENPAFAQFSQMMNSMFDSGLEMQKEYQKNIDALFESYQKRSGGEA
ncbi:MULTISPECIES: DUF937 domain-containing protein [Sinorhizobium]|uniref:DUF937 domain-containing protein n=1 Tax=Sinorhizobium americanum TaxID=194963 RepID=A0A2S3YI02_9HYPH|nr:MULTISPECIES: DUF937 domain-containing protein [Sinorhizobium]PDT40776.1 hypothetical protein CO656_15770 [Sinorhizobium sp. FG01]POH26375.1 hypothetical protein ATY31_25470 [Sinorhizobium americanum]